MTPIPENLTVKEALKKLFEGKFADSVERDELLETISAAPETLKPADLVWMAFRPDRILRETCGRLLQEHRTLETVELFLSHSRGQRDPAIRAAALVMFSLRVPGTESLLLRLAESNDIARRATAHKIVLSCPPVPALERVFWKLSMVGDLESRLRYLDRLGTFELSQRSLNRWEHLVSHEDREVREKALTVIAEKAPEPYVDLLVANLSKVRQEARELMVAAIAGVAKGKGAEFAEHILPLMASGDSVTRSAVVAILLEMPDRPQLIRRYLEFSKGLAGWTRDRALESMKTFGPDMIDSVLELLADDDFDIRFAALHLLGSYKDPKTVPAIMPLLKDDDWWLRITAAEILGKIGDPRAARALTDLLDDPEARWAAIDALGMIGDERALPALAKLLQSDEVEVRIEVLMALKHFDHPRIDEVLLQVANSDSNRNVQLRALSVLKEIQGAQVRCSGRPGRDPRQDHERPRQRWANPSSTSSCGRPGSRAASDLHLTVGQPPIDAHRRQDRTGHGGGVDGRPDPQARRRNSPRGTEATSAWHEPAARLLPLHPGWRPLPGQRLSRPARLQRRVSGHPGAPADI